MTYSRFTSIAAMAMLSSGMLFAGNSRNPTDWWGDAKYPINTGMISEKDSCALEKAKAKRERRAAKRVADHI